MDGGTLQTIPVSFRRGTASDDSGASADGAGASCCQLGSPICLASGNANQGVAAGELHSGGMHSQTIPDKKPKSTASATPPVCLRFNSGPYDPPSRRCRASHACGAVPETSAKASPAKAAGDAETDPALLCRLYQEAQDAVGSPSNRSTG